MASGKNFAGWVSGEYVEPAEQIVASEYDGNTSKFVADLVIDRVKHGPPKVRANPLALRDLAEAVHPTIADELGAALAQHGTNQPRALVRLLEAALEAVNRGVDLTKPVSLFTSEQEMAAYLAEHQSGPDFLHKLRNLVESMEPAGAEYGVIPNSPVNQLLAEEQKRRAGRAAVGGAGTKPAQTGKGTRLKARGGEA